MVIVFLIILALIVFVAWKVYQGWNSTVPQPLPPPVVAQPLPVHEYTVELFLPSSLPSLKFGARFTVKYLLKGELRIGEDVRRVLEWELHQAAQSVTSQFPLTVSRYLHLALNDRLNAWRWVREGVVGFQAECTGVQADPKDLALAAELERARFTLEMEAQLHDARLRGAERLGGLLGEPRTAALWWFAQHPDRVEDLPRITELMYTLDAQLNHRGAVLGPGVLAVGDEFSPTSGTDLDVFLTGAKSEERTLLLNTLTTAYERLGRPDLAERARTLADVEEDEADVR
ncbi:hypothetical protein [Glycomyces terrestris]|uniref:Uncharacterized protein n=1 Tax=Glycomyces terrestris TaxID=2493553 RepID=A0A426UZV8_9ACTN|nr:hypothetical protein [Glycomyces terrestris]RRS00159.1 hypothetical protein EIW28_06075 [Glycomyces terrestris]